MFQELLVHIPFEKWSELHNAFKTDWPRGAAGYMILDTQKLLIEEGYDYGFKVYCPFGEVRNGMVAVNVKETLNEIIIHCPQDDTGKLEDALRNTKRVNWQKSVVPSAPYHVIHCLQRVLGEHINVKLLPSDTFIYDKPVAFKNTDLPPEITFGLITSDNLDLVDSTWPYRYASSRWYFQLLINMKFGYGLFEANQLVAWVLVNEAGVLLHLYTVESHRRKGYAELILKLVSNILVKEGKPVIVYCMKGNVNAYKLYEKLGFLYTHDVAWCYLNNSLV